MLRISTLGAAAMGTLGLGLQGQLSPVGTTVALSLELAATAAGVLFPDGRSARTRRRTANALALTTGLLCAYLLVASVSHAGRDTAVLRQIGVTLSVPLALLVVSQLTSADSAREQRLVLVMSLLCGVLALGTAPPSGAADLRSELGACLGLGWLAGMVSLWLLQRARETSAATCVYRGRVLDEGRRQASFILGSAAIGIGTVLLLPQPNGWHVPESPGRSTEDIHPSQPTRGDGPPAPRGPESYLSGRVDLRSRGRLLDTRLMSVPWRRPEMWAGSVLYNYDGRYWTPSSHRVRGFVLPLDSAGDYDLRPGARPGAEPARATRADTVRILNAGRGLPVISWGQPLAVHLLEGRVVRVAGSTVTITGTPAPPSSYMVRSIPDIAGRATQEDIRLPSSLPHRVRDLAHRITQGAATTQGKVQAIESYLREHHRYRLDSPVPAEGEDAVDDFLFVSHEGFCEQFASAEAVLLRSVGVPARVVIGFVGGVTEHQRRIFRGTDAHAWVQVHVGDQRWVYSDPTAGVALATPRLTWTHRARSVLVEHWQLAASSLLSLIVLLLLAARFMAQALKRHRRERELAAPIRARVLAAFAHLESTLPRIQLARAPESSVHELTQSLLARWPGGVPDPDGVTEALVVVERVLYDAVPVPEATSLTAIAELHLLAELARKTDPSQVVDMTHGGGAEGTLSRRDGSRQAVS